MVSIAEVQLKNSAKNNIFQTISDLDIHLRPINNSQEILRSVPGLFIGQHAGGGKAEQLFIRGFDVDHGTDVSLSVDGIPVNMVSHAHGQGYADLHFIIPETIDKIDFGKHSGHTLEEIYRFSPSYLEWAIEYVDNFILDINEFENLPQPTPYIKLYPHKIKDNIILQFFSHTESDIQHAYNALKNGEILNEIDYHFPERIKEINNKKINLQKKLDVWKFYKPLNYITSRNKQDDRPIIYDLLPFNLKKIKTVGRLDINSEGLLLLTDDGEIIRNLELPKNKFSVDSAGTGSWHVGHCPDKRSIEVARKNGINISAQKGRQIKTSDFDESVFSVLIIICFLFPQKY